MAPQTRGQGFLLGFFFLVRSQSCISWGYPFTALIFHNKTPLSTSLRRLHKEKPPRCQLRLVATAGLARGLVVLVGGAGRGGGTCCTDFNNPASFNKDEGEKIVPVISAAIFQAVCARKTWAASTVLQLGSLYVLHINCAAMINMMSHC